MRSSIPTFDEALLLRPAIRDDILLSRLGHEAVAWSPIRPEALYLDPVACQLLDIFDGSGTISEIIDDVVDAVGVANDVAADQIMRVLHGFDAGGLLESSDELDEEWDDDAVLTDPPDF